jgi:putative DNA primase/helicase
VTDESNQGTTIIYLDAAAKDQTDRYAKPPQSRTKPTITVQAGKLDVLATEGEDALIASGLPIFQRGDRLVRPTEWEVPASNGRRTIATGLKEIRAPGLIDLMAQSAEFVKYDARRKKDTPTDPPDKVAQIILSRGGTWRLPTIGGVITTPTMRPDGSILSQPGYDAATRLYYVGDPSMTMPPIAAKPTKEDAEHALSLLRDLWPASRSSTTPINQSHCPA